MKHFLINNSLLLILAVILVTISILRLLQDYDHPDSHVIPNFPLIAQPDQITCGPTSVTMVLLKYGKKVDLDSVKRQTKTEFFQWNGNPIGGTTPEYIEEALKHFGVDADMKGASLDQLKYYISQDRPCIVLVRSGDTLWHYVVVVGYDKDRIEVADPAGGQRYKMKTSQFMGAWQFKTDMEGNPTTGPLADALLFLVRSGEAKTQTLIVPTLHIPETL
jgi:predicted double-glycine peptidase